MAAFKKFKNTSANIATTNSKKLIPETYYLIQYADEGKPGKPQEAITRFIGKFYGYESGATSRIDEEGNQIGIVNINPLMNIAMFTDVKILSTIPENLPKNLFENIYIIKNEKKKDKFIKKAYKCEMLGFDATKNFIESNKEKVGIPISKWLFSESVDYNSDVVGKMFTDKVEYDPQTLSERHAFVKVIGVPALTDYVSSYI